MRLGYCFTLYQRLWPYNGTPLVAFYDTRGIRRTYSQLKPPASSRGVRLCVCLFGSHTFFVVAQSYVSQVTRAFLRMLPLCCLSILGARQLTAPQDIMLPLETEHALFVRRENTAPLQQTTLWIVVPVSA